MEAAEVEVPQGEGEGVGAREALEALEAQVAQEVLQVLEVPLSSPGSRTGLLISNSSNPNSSNNSSSIHHLSSSSSNNSSNNLLKSQGMPATWCQSSAGRWAGETSGKAEARLSLSRRGRAGISLRSRASSRRPSSTGSSTTTIPTTTTSSSSIISSSNSRPRSISSRSTSSSTGRHSSRHRHSHSPTGTVMHRIKRTTLRRLLLILTQPSKLSTHLRVRMEQATATRPPCSIHRLVLSTRQRQCMQLLPRNLRTKCRTTVVGTQWLRLSPYTQIPSTQLPMTTLPHRHMCRLSTSNHRLPPIRLMIKTMQPLATSPSMWRLSHSPTIESHLHPAPTPSTPTLDKYNFHDVIKIH